MSVGQAWRWLNGQAGWVFLAGLGAVVLVNARRWSQDRARALHLRERQGPPATLRTTPKVSVLVAAWDEAGIIRQHIESFRQLRYPAKELILCAGGPDDTYALARSYAGPQVTVLEQRPGDGKQGALQRCLERASGEVIFLTDADSLYDEQAFERTLAPVINGEAAVATGTFQPFPCQRANRFVLHRWFTKLYSEAGWGRYADGLVGANTALRRDVLEAIGGFTAEVKTGTDYHMAKKLRHHGYPIRYVPDSVVSTAYAETVANYWTQQARWLRNVVMHGLRFGAYGEVARCLLPSFLGLGMLAGLPIGLVLGPVGVAAWALGWVFVLVSRVRYMRFGTLLTGYPFGTGYLWLPFYIALDFGVWALTALQYLFREGRSRW